MAAYLIAQISIHDLETFKKYQAEVPATIAKHGGKYLVRGGDVTPTEGNWQPDRVVVLEFPDMATLKTWYNSEDYQAIIGFRTDAAEGDMIFVEGV
ncbi:MAG: DUF1330 domain-containing protein [Alphaproteobacteria bacterium]|nr:DUF1330 domain-containing protein [Alphaproteobacteria bacterium]